VSEQKDASTIPVSRLDPNFKYEVAGLAGGERIKSCFQCGTCTASCPVRATDENYNPRKIIRMVLLGMRDEVLGNEPIWLCTYCYTCQERCPQDVGITDLMFALKNLAAREGHMHPSYAPQIDVLANFGRMYEVSTLTTRRGQRWVSRRSRTRRNSLNPSLWQTISRRRQESEICTLSRLHHTGTRPSLRTFSKKSS
jgi:heterodisulfide reductase subunit C